MRVEVEARVAFERAVAGFDLVVRRVRVGSVLRLRVVVIPPRAREPVLLLNLGFIILS